MSASSITAQRLARSQQRHAGVEKYAASTETSSKFTVAPPTAPLDTFCSKVVERCGPAVVKILTEREREAEDSDLMELLEQLFSGAGGGEVFIGADGIVIGDGRHGSGGHHSRNRRRRKRSVMRGQGSGFLIDSAGTILTNAHVVKGASVVKVLLTTGQQLIGEVRGLDSVLDVAVVSVAAPPTLMLPAAIPLSDGSRLKVGQWAISIGNPLGLNNSVSLGVLSSLLPSTETALDWVSHDHLQTDAAINQGNSGGPLLNERGEAIGLVHAKAGGMHTEGVGFAIPMRVILPLLPHLASGRIIQHAMLGVQMCDAHAEAAELVRDEYDLPAYDGTRGALVMSVLPSSPAAVAAVQPGDLITSVSGRRVSSCVEVQQLVAGIRLGNSVVELGLMRRGGPVGVRVRPIDFDEYTKARQAEQSSQRLGSPSRSFVLMP